MKFGLRDLFLGIIHIFVIFIPGGILLGVILYFAGSLGLRYVPENIETVHWLAFFVGSFIIGHLVSYLGSRMEDASKYLEKDVKPEFREIAASIVRSKLPRKLTKESNTRRWAQTLLRQEDPPSFGEIERKDADRRFFRNLRVIVPISLLLFSATAFFNAVKYFYPIIDSAPSSTLYPILTNVKIPYVCFPIAALTLVFIAFLFSAIVTLRLVVHYGRNPQEKGTPTYFKRKANKCKPQKTAKEVLSHDDLKEVKLGRRFVTIFIILVVGFILLFWINKIVSWTGYYLYSGVAFKNNLIISGVLFAIVLLMRDLIEVRFFDQDKKFTRLLFESLVTAFPQNLSTFLPQSTNTSTSHEVRWFFESHKNPSKGLKQIFKKNSSPPTWNDHYYIKVSEDKGLKWRDGRMEIKSRIDDIKNEEKTIEKKVNDIAIKGNIEHWEKQAFETKEQPLIGNGDENKLWICVRKKRKIVKYLLDDKNGLTGPCEAEKHYDGSGCAVELTRLRAGEKGAIKTWTLAFEAFGPEDKQLTALTKCINEVLNPTWDKIDEKLNSHNSYGYPTWILKQFPNL